MTYPEALSFLGQSRFFGMKPGLDRMRRLAQRLGDPQDKLRFIHIAGTNGKGSTAAFCESCLRAAGFRVGLYTSPHLVSVRERFQISRIPISESVFGEGMEVVREAMGNGVDSEATFFEITTALALWHFARENVDWVVWETGLGGRLDATNIVEAKVCIITNIGLDHQKYLGETLREIAVEKAGIVKENAAVVSAVEIGEASEIIREQAKPKSWRLTLVHRDMDVKDLGLREGKQVAKIDGNEFVLGLIGPHQILNAACAVEAMWRLRSDLIQMEWEREELYSISDFAIAQGLESTGWPGRFEIISEKPLIVLDGAHNPPAIKMLVETWRVYLASRFGWSEQQMESRAHLVFASVADKDISEMAQLLRPLASQVSIVRLANERTAEPAQLAQAFSGLPCVLYDSVAEMWRKVDALDSDKPILITGSLFLVGEMLAQKQGSAGEYRLNERLEPPTATRSI